MIVYVLPFLFNSFRNYYITMRDIIFFFFVLLHYDEFAFNFMIYFILAHLLPIWGYQFYHLINNNKYNVREILNNMDKMINVKNLEDVDNAIVIYKKCFNIEVTELPLEKFGDLRSKIYNFIVLFLVPFTYRYGPYFIPYNESTYYDERIELKKEYSDDQVEIKVRITKDEAERLYYETFGNKIKDDILNKKLQHDDEDSDSESETEENVIVDKKRSFYFF